MELDNNRLDSFHDDIMKVVEKYPEFYIESWGPEEFLEVCPDITIEECIIMSQQVESGEIEDNDDHYQNETSGGDVFSVTKEEEI